MLQYTTLCYIMQQMLMDKSFRNEHEISK